MTIDDYIFARIVAETIIPDPLGDVPMPKMPIDLRASLMGCFIYKERKHDGIDVI